MPQSTKEHGSLIRTIFIWSICLLSLAGFLFLLISVRSLGSQSRPIAFFRIPAGGEGEPLAVKSKTLLGFDLVDSQCGVNHHVLCLKSNAVDSLLNARTIGFQMVCNSASAEVISAEIAVYDKATGGVTARYRAKHGSLIQENRALFFQRSSPELATPPTGEQTIYVHIISRGGGALAVQGQFSEHEPVSGSFFWMPATFQGKAGVASAYGWYQKWARDEAFSKAQLLAYTWGFGIRGYWVVYALIMAASIVWLLGLLALTRCLQIVGIRWESPLTALGAGLLFFSIGLVYSILVPPFQSPDEPDHFLSLSEVVGRPELAKDALQLANISHFERIKFRTDEIFSGADVGRPLSEGWASHVEAMNPNRSPVMSAIWALAGPLFKKNHAGTALLVVRILNVLFVSLCLTSSLALMAWALKPGSLSIFAVAPVIFTPSISFFSMGVSNYPFLIGGYVVQAGALGLMWAQLAASDNRLRIQGVVGALSGLGIALAIGSGDNGMFALAFWGLLVPLYWFLRGLHSEELPNELGRFRLFGFTFTGAMTFGWLVTGLGAASFGIVPLMLPESLRAVLSGVGLQYLGVKTLIGIGFVGAVLVASYALVCAGWKIRRWSWLPFARRAIVVVLLAGLFYIALAHVPQIPENRSTGIWDFDLKVSLAFLKWFEHGRNDLLVAQSFWGNFGWLDAPLPGLLIALLKTMALAGIGFLAYFSFRANKYFGGPGFLAINLLSIMAFVACTSAGYYSVQNIVNGRYLIGPYLLLLIMAYEGYRRLFASSCEFAPWVVSGVCLAAMGIQYAAWMSVLARYF